MSADCRCSIPYVGPARAGWSVLGVAFGRILKLQPMLTPGIGPSGDPGQRISQIHQCLRRSISVDSRCIPLRTLFAAFVPQKAVSVHCLDTHFPVTTVTCGFTPVGGENCDR